MQTLQRDLEPMPTPPEDRTQSVWESGNRDKDSRHFLARHRVATIVIGHISVVAVIGILLLGNGLGMRIFSAFAQSRCSSGDQAYVVVSGDTLSGIAARFNTTWGRLASYNHIADPNLIFINQTVCIPGKPAVSSGPPPARGTGNSFPYAQCTWWADERYHQLHNVYVPWMTQSDAWQWTERAQQFHWRVSNSPTVGSILDLQPWVDGAWGYGHVAVVEQILGNGDVIASSMNWGYPPWDVVNVEYSPGPGVTFISF